jgi:hypothetical protein
MSVVALEVQRELLARMLVGHVGGDVVALGDVPAVFRDGVLVRHAADGPFDESWSRRGIRHDQAGSAQLTVIGRSGSRGLLTT